MFLWKAAKALKPVLLLFAVGVIVSACYEYGPRYGPGGHYRTGYSGVYVDHGRYHAPRYRTKHRRATHHRVQRRHVRHHRRATRRNVRYHRQVQRRQVHHRRAHKRRANGKRSRAKHRRARQERRKRSERGWGR